MFQLKYAICQAKKERYGGAKIKVDELRKWFEDNATLPENEDTAIIPVSKLDVIVSSPNPQEYIPDKIVLNCILTTKRLIKNAADKQIIHADSTYKLNYMGYPLLVFGTTDQGLF